MQNNNDDNNKLDTIQHKDGDDDVELIEASGGKNTGNSDKNSDIDIDFWDKFFAEEDKKKSEQVLDNKQNDVELIEPSGSKNTGSSDKNSDIDIDFWDKFFAEEDKKTPPKTVSSEITQDTKDETKTDDFDWLKDLIDEIDKEEQDKKKQQQLPATTTQPAPSKPKFTGKLRDRPRPPPPPEHVANWGKKTVTPTESGIAIPGYDNSRTHDTPNKKFAITGGIYMVIMVIVVAISSLVGIHIYSSMQANKTCHGCNIVLAQTYSGDKILLNINHVTQYGKDAMNHGYTDAQLLSLIYKILKPGDTVVDVGSGYGYDVIYAARVVGKTGKIYAVEGREDVAEMLENSLKINNIDNVVVKNSIAFSKKTEVYINYEDYNKNSHFGVLNMNFNGVEGSNDVIMDTDTIDNIIGSVKDVKLMHINTNGTELNVLIGGKNIIANSPNIKIITTWNKHQMAKYVNVHHVVRQLFDIGFRFWLIKSSSGSLTEMITAEHVLQVERGRFIIAKNLDLN